MSVERKEKSEKQILSTEGQIHNTIYKMLYIKKIEHNILNEV